MRLIVGVAVLALAAACTTAEAPSPAPSAPLAAAPAAKTGPQAVPVAASDKKICKSMPITGSVSSKRVCSTQAEWDAFNKKAQEGSDKFDEQRKQGGQFRGETVQ
jgi:hypothetical protein